MTCANGSKEYINLVKYIKALLEENLEKKVPFNIDTIISTLKNDFSQNPKLNDPVVISSYVSSIPQAILDVQAKIKDLQDYVAPHYESIVKLRNTFEKATNVLNQLSGESKDNLIEEQEDLKDAINDGTLAMADAINYPHLNRDIDVAVPVYPFTDIGQEAVDMETNIPNPLVKIYYDVKKMIVNMMKSLPVHQDSTFVEIPGVQKGGVYLTAVHLDSIPENQRHPIMREKVQMVLTDKGGNFLYFNDKGEIVSPNQGKLMHYFFRNSDNPSHFGSVEAIIRESHKRGESIGTAEATELRRKQIESIDKIKNFILENPTKQVRNVITGGTLGYLKSSESTMTNLSKIKFKPEDPFSLVIEKGAGKGFKSQASFKIKGVDSSIHLRPKEVSQELAHKIATLLTTKDLYKEVDGELVPVSDLEKFEYLNSVYQNSPGTFHFTYKNDKISLRINNKFNGTKEEPDLIPPYEDIVKFLTNKYALEVKSYEQKGKKIFGPDVSIDSLYNGAMKYNNDGTVSKWVSPAVKIDAVSYLHSSEFKDISFTKVNGKDVMVEKPMPYSKSNADGNLVGFLADNTFINYEPNANGELIPLNAHFEFSPVLTDMESGVPELNVDTELDPETPEVPKAIDGPDQDLLDALSAAGFNKLASTKNLDAKATPEQLENAKKWYESSPLRHHFTLNILFNAVNTHEPNGVANWVGNAINLYKGSDYSDIYHEAWHGFTQMFLTREEKTKLYKEVSKQTGTFRSYRGRVVKFSEATTMELEEYLAEDFRNYMLSSNVKKSAPVRNSLFRKISNFLKQVFTGVSIKDALADAKSINNVRDLYENLRIGDLKKYTFSEANSNFDVLNKGVEALDDANPTPSLKYEDSSLLVDTVDSLFSHYIDWKNSGVQGGYKDYLRLLKLQQQERIVKPTIIDGETVKPLNAEEREELRLLKNMSIGRTKNTTSVISDPKKRTEAYKFVQAMLNYYNVKYTKQYHKETNVLEKLSIQRKLDTLKWAIENFGDVNKPGGTIDGKGVMNYHMKMSKYMAFSDKYFADLEADQAETPDSLGSKAGNEQSLTSMASDETLYLIRSLHAINLEGHTISNRIGVSKLVDFVTIWNKLTKILEGSRSPEEMEQKLLKENENGEFPIVTQLLSKLGPANSITEPAFTMWNKFFEDFNKSRMPLVQLNINMLDTGTPTARIHAEPGFSSRESKMIGRNWSNNFAKLPESKYIKKNSSNVNTLDIKTLLNDFPTHINNSYEFYNALGMYMDNNKKLREEVEAFGSNFIKAKLQKILDGKYTVKSLEDIFEKTYKSADGKDEKNEIKTWNELQQIQSRYGEQGASFAATNAAGKQQFEHTLNSTLTHLVNDINSVNTYQELVSLPHMLNYKFIKNPFIKDSIWLNSIFDFDNGGKKREVNTDEGRAKVKVLLENLAGMQLLEDGEGSKEGVTSSDADQFSKFLAEFHSGVLRGTIENSKHADKSTAVTQKLSHIFSIGSTSGRYYIDYDRFIATPEAAYSNMHALLLKYVNSELVRINRMKVAEKTKNDDYNVTDYMKRGQEFVIFDKVLSKDTKDKLYALDIPLTNYLATKTSESIALKTAITSELTKYFDNQTKLNLDIMSKSEFYADNLITELRRNAREELKDKFSKLDKEDILKRIMKGYTVNSWIHHMESIIMVYGDPAQYVIEKEEFNKRNAGVMATGLYHRIDETALKYANETLGRPFASKQNEKNKGVAGFVPNLIKQFSHLLTSAVINDVESKSANYKEYAEGIYQDELKKLQADPTYNNSSEKDKETFRKTAKSRVDDIMKKNYYAMEEANAQAHMSFDTYRTLLKLRSEWSEKQEQLFQDIINDKPVSALEVSEFFPVQKYQYWGPLDNGDQALGVNAMHKMAVMPLIPNLIKGTVLEQMHNKMMREGVDYTVFKSGSKMATLTDKGRTDNFYEQGTHSTTRQADFSTTSNPFVHNNVFLKYFKNQVYTAPKYKGTTIFSTQLRKLIEEGLMENGIPTDFKPKKFKDHNTRLQEWNKLSDKEKANQSDNWKLIQSYESNLSRLTEFKKQQLLEEAGGENADPKELIAFLKKELDRQDLGEHEKDFIEYNEEARELVNDLSLSMNADKLERLLTAIVNKKIIRQKVTGENLIQVSGVGFESMQHMQDKLKNATDVEKEKYSPTNDLLSYRLSADGRTVLAAQVKVSMQGNFKILLNHPDVYVLSKEKGIERLDALNELIKNEQWLDKEDNRKMITMVGVRIPVQGLNAMEFMQIHHFLPESSGNIIIPPAEIVAKSGSDFDVDKMTTLMPNLYRIENKVKIYKAGEKIASKSEVLNTIRDIRIKLNASREWHDEVSKSIKKAGVKDLEPDQRALFDKLKKDYKEESTKLNTEIAYLQNEFAAITRGEYDNDIVGRFKDNKRSYEYAKKIEDGFIEAINKQAKLDSDFKQNRKEYLKVFKSELFDLENEAYDKEMEPIQADLEDAVARLNGNDGKAYENALIDDMTNILSLKSNFGSLVRPNAVDLVRPFSEKMKSLNEPGMTKEKPSGTSIFEIGYNLAKHTANNVGKQILGILAVANTYHTLFKRIGMYMNPTFTQAGRKTSVTRHQRLLLNHNFLTLANGQKAISLSHTYDAKFQNKISDIINQLINGSVDVAKGAWIFDLHAEKEVLPTLNYMIEAGIPFEEAVLFVSQPLIREYVMEMKQGKSTFSTPLGKDPGNPNWFRVAARQYLLDKTNVLSKETLTDTKENFNKLMYDKIEENLQKYYDEPSNNAFTPETLQKNIEKYSALEDKSRYVASQDEIANFLHFLEIEDMSKVITEIKTKTNFDTKKSASIFDSISRDHLLAQLMTNDRVNRDLIESIITESPIASFKIGEYMKKLWQPFFKLRNSDIMNNYKLKLLGTKGFSKIVDDTFGDTEKFMSEFSNDFVSYIFQNEIRGVNLNAVTDYKGVKVENVALLKTGSFIKDGVLYIDKNALHQEFVANSAKTLEEVKFLYDKTRKLALCEPGTFSTEREFNAFALERAYLTSTLTPEKVATDPNFLKAINDVLKDSGAKKQANETQEEFDAKVKRIAFQFYIRDKALDNSFNAYKMFNGENSFADRFMEIKKLYPEFIKDYYIFQVMAQNMVKGSNHLYLTDSLLDATKINTLHENISELSNLTPDMMPDPGARELITDLFKMLPYYAFMQSGMNAKGRYALTRLIPTDGLMNMLKPVVNKYNKYLNESVLDSYYSEFVANNNYKTRMNSKFKDYMVPSSFESIVRSESLKNKGTIEDINESTSTTFVVKPTKDPLINTYHFDTINYSQVGIPLILEDPNNANRIFVYNTVAEGMPLSQVVNTDGDVRSAKTSNRIGIATKKAFPEGTKIEAVRDNEGKLVKNAKGTNVIKANYTGSEVMKNTLTDETYEQNIKAIDASIELLKKFKERGKIITFNSNGYGQGLIGRNPVTGEKIANSTEVGRQTFLYLSKQLLDNFNFRNKNYETLAEGTEELQKRQPVSDKDVLDFMIKFCGVL